MVITDSLPQGPVIMVAESSSVTTRNSELFGSIGECRVVSSKPSDWSQELFVADATWNIFRRKNPNLVGGMPEFKAHPELYEGAAKYFGADDIHSATVEIIEDPKHGSIIKDKPYKEVPEDIYYRPDLGF